MADWNDYTWIVVTGCLAAFFTAYGIGANDVANAFGSSVAARTLTMRQALAIATVCEFGGSVLLGGEVTRTVAGSIAKLTAFEREPQIYMYGMLCALVASGTWLIVATYLELPVSTTHSIVGAVMGFAIVYGGPHAVVWLEPQDDFPYMRGMVPIVVSWFISPLLSALACALFFFFVRSAILRRANSLELAFWALPVLVTLTVYINVYLVLYKGADTRISWTSGKCAWVAAAAAGGCGLLTAMVGMPLVRQYVYTELGVRRRQQLSELERQVKAGDGRGRKGPTGHPGPQRPSAQRSSDTGSGGRLPRGASSSSRSTASVGGSGGGMAAPYTGAGVGPAGGGGAPSGAPGFASPFVEYPHVGAGGPQGQQPLHPHPQGQGQGLRSPPPALANAPPQPPAASPLGAPPSIPARPGSPGAAPHASTAAPGAATGTAAPGGGAGEESPVPQQPGQGQAPPLQPVNVAGGGGETGTGSVMEAGASVAQDAAPDVSTQQQRQQQQQQQQQQPAGTGATADGNRAVAAAVLGQGGRYGDEAAAAAEAAGSAGAVQPVEQAQGAGHWQQQQQYHPQQQYWGQQQQQWEQEQQWQWHQQQQQYGMQPQYWQQQHEAQAWEQQQQQAPYYQAAQQQSYAPYQQQQQQPHPLQQQDWSQQSLYHQQLFQGQQDQQQAWQQHAQQQQQWGYQGQGAHGQLRYDQAAVSPAAAGQWQSAALASQQQTQQQHQMYGRQAYGSGGGGGGRGGQLPPAAGGRRPLGGPIAESLEWGQRSPTGYGADGGGGEVYGKQGGGDGDGGGGGAAEGDAAAPSDGDNVQWQNTFDQLKAIVLHGTNIDVHDAIATDATTRRIHAHAEVFDPATEHAFKYLQVVTAMCDSFSHGANDVANSVGPLAAIWYIFRNERVDYMSDLPTWILVLGGAGIVVGLATYGYNIIRAIGVRFSAITPSRGFCIELSTALVVVVAAKYGLPISTTHCQVGATAGMGLMEGAAGLHWRLALNFFLGWVVTLFITGLLCAGLFAAGAYAPSVQQGRALLSYQDALVDVTSRLEQLLNRTNTAALADPATWGNFSASLNASVAAGLRTAARYAAPGSSRATRAVQVVEPAEMIGFLNSTLYTYVNNSLPYVGGMQARGQVLPRRP